jgi:glutamine---fructose-6-phosphate transaminase (isomerizing)
VRARGGDLYVVADQDSGVEASEGVHVIHLPKHVSYLRAPGVSALPHLSYPVAMLRGTDVDQPRNIAKSMTVRD